MASFFSSLLGGRKQNEDEKANVFPEDSFSMLQAEADGMAVTGSVNKGYKDYGRKEDFPWCLHIGIALNADSVQGNGLPKSDEMDIAYRQEDILLEDIKNIETTHFIGHLFNDGFLDVYLYLPEPQKVHDYLQTQINKEGLLRGFGYEINKDPNWDRVEVFMK